MKKIGSDVMNYFKDGLSVDESRISLLMLALAVTIGFALWQFATVGFIDPSMLTLLAYLIGAVTGLNIVDKFKQPSSGSNNFNNEDIGG
jgi:hypothetical protein